MLRLALPVTVAAVAYVALACRIAEIGCAGVGIAGVVVDVRDPEGNQALPATMVVATDGSYADTVGPVVPAYRATLRGPTGPTAELAENRGGDYVVTASKPYWSTATVRVHVPGGRCGDVETQHVQLTVAKLPNAPAVRSVAVAPRFVRFSFCGSGAAASAFVDADAGLAGGVVWQSADTNVVGVSQEGLVTVKSRGITRVSARAVADPTVVGYLTAQVDPTCR